MRELLEIERIARELLGQAHDLHLIGECDATCGKMHDCDKDHEVVETCPHCKKEVTVKITCDNEIECKQECCSEVELELGDETGLLRQLELALVALDLARLREQERAAAQSTSTATPGEAA